MKIVYKKQLTIFSGKLVTTTLHKYIKNTTQKLIIQ